MCYELYLSTTSPEDLTRYNSELVHFERAENIEDKIAQVLLHPVKWYIGSQSGCSCAFRHSAKGDAEFREPQDWYPENEENIEATAELYRVIASLMQEEHKVDCVDLWPEVEPVEVKTTVVNLGAVPENAFRLFENHHFVFEP